MFFFQLYNHWIFSNFVETKKLLFQYLRYEVGFDAQVVNRASEKHIDDPRSLKRPWHHHHHQQLRWQQISKLWHLWLTHPYTRRKMKKNGTHLGKILNLCWVLLHILAPIFGMGVGLLHVNTQKKKNTTLCDPSLTSIDKSQRQMQKKKNPPTLQPIGSSQFLSKQRNYFCNMFVTKPAFGIQVVDRAREGETHWGS